MFHSGREMSLAGKTKGHASSRPNRARGVPSSPSDVNNEVTFLTVGGLELRARLARLTRHLATFEAENLAATLQTSEVLANFKITAGARVIYLGRAVVGGIIHTGDALLC